MKKTLCLQTYFFSGENRFEENLMSSNLFFQRENIKNIKNLKNIFLRGLPTPLGGYGFEDLPKIGFLGFLCFLGFSAEKIGFKK